MDAQCLTRSHQAACSKARMLPSTWLAFAHGLKGNMKASGWSISDVANYIPDGPSPEEQGLGEMLSQLGDRIAKQRGAKEEGLSFLFVCVNLDPACRGFVDGTSWLSWTLHPAWTCTCPRSCQRNISTVGSTWQSESWQLGLMPQGDLLVDSSRPCHHTS